MRHRYFVGLIVLLTLLLGLPLAAQANPVGRFTQVEGTVDIMKGGQAPAIPVKVQDPVELGDAVRTKSLSKAQIQFIDDTTLTVAPESRIAVDEYMYDASKAKRQATVQVFRGMVHFVVNKILQTEKPDFLMKTHTGVLGVRGTEWYGQLTATHTDIYNAHGTTEVHNVFAEVPGKVTLTGMEFTRVGVNVPPTLPLPITAQDLHNIQMNFSSRSSSSTGSGNTGGGTTGGGSTSGTTGSTGGTGGTSSLGSTSADTSPLGTGGLGGTNLPGGGTNLGGLTGPQNNNNNPNNNIITPPYTPPTPPPPPTGPTYGTYAFLAQSYGYATYNLDPSGSSATLSTSGWGARSGVYAAYYTLSGTGTRVFSSPILGGSLPPSTWATTTTGSVSGILGQALTGTFTTTGTDARGGTFSYSGPITINPDGTSSASYTNMTSSSGTTGTGSHTTTPGTYFTQTALGSVAMTGNSNGSSLTMTNNNRDTTNGTYPIWGSRTGVYPGSFSANINMTSYASTQGYYPPADQGSLGATMQGVVSGPAGGTQTGVMTMRAGGQGSEDTPWTLSGPVTINSNGNLSVPTFYGNNTDNSGTVPSGTTFRQQGSWTQTAVASIPTASTYTFSTPFVGSVFVNPTSTTSAGIDLSGYSTRSNGTSVYPGTYLGFSNGTATGYFTVGNTYNGPISGTLSGSVSGVLGGYDLTGTATFTSGSNVLTGDVTIKPSGKMVFNYSGPLTVSGQTVNVSGTMTQEFAIGVTETASGNYRTVPSSSSNPVLVNAGQMAGSRTMNGGSPTGINASLALTWGNGYALPSPPSVGTYSITSGGAVYPWYGGEQAWGVMGTNVNVSGNNATTVSNVTFDASTGNISGQIANGSGGYGPYINGTWASARLGSGQTTASFYVEPNGNYQLSSSSPYANASITSNNQSGLMYTGGALTGPPGSTAGTPYPMTGNFSFNGSGQAGAFPASASDSARSNVMGAVAGPANGVMKGWAMGSWQAYASPSWFGGGFGGTAWIDNTTPTPANTHFPQVTVNLSQGNTGTSPNGQGISVDGSYYLEDPPLTGTATASSAATGTTSRAQSWADRRAAWQAYRGAALQQAAALSPGGVPATAGPNGTYSLPSRFTRLTGTSMGARLQRIAQLRQWAIQNPALAQNLQAARRLRRQQRLEAMRAATGPQPAVNTTAANILLLQQKH